MVFVRKCKLSLFFIDLIIKIFIIIKLFKAKRSKSMREKLDILLKEAIISLILCIIVFILMILNWKIGAVALLFQIYRVFDIMIKNSSFNEDETRMYIRLIGSIVSIAIFIMML
jgi:hypothetical protein